MCLLQSLARCHRGYLSRKEQRIRRSLLLRALLRFGAVVLVYVGVAARAASTVVARALCVSVLLLAVFRTWLPFCRLLPASFIFAAVSKTPNLLARLATLRRLGVSVTVVSFRRVVGSVVSIVGRVELNGNAFSPW